MQAQNPHRLHDRQDFYKYMSASTAAAVLAHARLRWSSPLIFNDPFDVPRESAFGISLPEISAAADTYWFELLQNPPADYSKLSDKLAAAVQAVQGPERFRIVTRLIAKSIEKKPKKQSPETLAAFAAIKEMWQQTLPRLRILCLSENPERISMWYHYADRYKGVVLDLDCSDALDSPWLKARKIAYPTIPPEIFSPKGWAKILTLKPKYAIEAMLDAYILHKTEDWSYEQEWRLYTFARDGESGLYEDYPIDQRNFKRLRLGPFIEPSARDTLLTIVRDSKLDIEIVQARFEIDRRISYEKL